jgi:hypothetical protein
LESVRIVTDLPFTVALAVETTGEAAAGVVGAAVGVLVAAGLPPVVVELEFPQAASSATSKNRAKELRTERFKTIEFSSLNRFSIKKSCAAR